MLSPKEVSKVENFLLTSPYKSPLGVKYQLNPSINTALLSNNNPYTTAAATLKQNYLLQLDTASNTVSLWFTQSTNTEQSLKGFVHATTLRYLKDIEPHSSVEDLIQRSVQLIDSERYGRLTQSMVKKGWKLDNLFIETGRSTRIYIEYNQE